MKELDQVTAGAVGKIIDERYKTFSSFSGFYTDPFGVDHFFDRAGVTLSLELVDPVLGGVSGSVAEILYHINGTPDFERVLLRLASPLEYGGDLQEHARTLQKINKILWGEGLEIILDGHNPVIRDLGTSEKETKMTPSQITDTKHWLEKIAAYERGHAEAVAEALSRGQGARNEVVFGDAEHKAVVNLHRNGLIERPNIWFHNPENHFSSAGIYAYRLTDAGREFLAIHSANPASNNNRQLPAVIRSPDPMAARDNSGSVTKHQLRAFITHGKNRDYLADTQDVCRQLGIEPVVAIESPNLSRSVAEKVSQEMASCEIYIALLTRDDGNAASSNAIGELHHAVFSHPDNIIIYRERGVELPSNLRGRATGWLEGQWKFNLLQELQKLISQVTQG